MRPKKDKIEYIFPGMMRVPHSFIKWLIKNGVPLVKSEIPLYDIPKDPKIPLMDIKQRRFDLIERAQDLARSQIQEKENETN